MESILDGRDFLRYFHCIPLRVDVGVVVVVPVPVLDTLHSMAMGAVMGIEALELLVLLRGKNLSGLDSKERDRKRLVVRTKVERKEQSIHTPVLGVQLVVVRMQVQNGPRKNCAILAVDCTGQDCGYKPVERPLEQVVCTQ